MGNRSGQLRWLCDVFVDESVRGLGLGTFLVECASSVDQVRGVGLRLLATRDSYALYERSGFRPASPGRFMERRREAPPSASASGEAHPPD